MLVTMAAAALFIYFTRSSRRRMLPPLGGEVMGELTILGTNFRL